MSDACKSVVAVFGNGVFADGVQALLDAVFAPCPHEGCTAVVAADTAGMASPIAAIRIETPLLPPTPLIAELSVALPELAFQLRYDIEVIGLGGQIEFLNGVVRTDYRDANGVRVVLPNGSAGAAEKVPTSMGGEPLLQWIRQQADLRGLRPTDAEGLRRSPLGGLPSLRAVAEELLARGYSYIYDGASGVVSMGRRDSEAMHGYLNAYERVTALLRPEDKQAMKACEEKHEAAAAMLSRRATACMEMLDALKHFKHPEITALLDAADRTALKQLDGVLMKVRPDYWAALDIPGVGEW